MGRRKQGNAPMQRVVAVPDLGARFLLPLLHGPPATQLLQFRGALLQAHEMQRTLVLPNLVVAATTTAAGTQAAAPRPLASVLDTEQLARIVPVVDLSVFRALANGALDVCVCANCTVAAAAFERYLGASKLRCSRWARTAEAATRHRFLGYHLAGVHGRSTRAFAYMAPSRSVADIAGRILESLGVGSGGFVAAHVPDKGADEVDCNLFVRGLPGKQFIACGNHSSRIGAKTQAAIIWHLIRTRSGLLRKAAGAVRVYVASSSDPTTSPRVKSVVRALGELGATVVTARTTVGTLTEGDAIATSSVEQAICTRAELFIGSRYSSYADTVNGMRQADWARRVSSGADPGPTVRGKAPRYPLYTYEGLLSMYQAWLPGALVAHQEGGQLVL